MMVEWIFGREKRRPQGINLLLASLVVLLVIRIGAMCYAALPETVMPAAAWPASGSAADTIETVQSDPTLRDYHLILDRNLFGSMAAPATDAEHETADTERIKISGNEVGMKLIGTVVTKDRQLNYAVVEMVKDGKQAIFRENERIGGVLIKQIFRNNVIIATSSGEQRLTITGVSLPQVPSADVEDKGVILEIPRNEIAEYLPGIVQMLKESNSAPNISDGKADGFSVGRLRANDVLFRIGLRTGDVIKEVNGEEIDSPDDVESLAQRMARGGEFSVLIKRRGQLQQLNLSTN